MSNDGMFVPVRAGASAVSQPWAGDDSSTVAVAGAGDGSSGSSIQLVDLGSGEVVQELSVQGWDLKTDSGSPVGVSLLALGQKGDASTFRWAVLPAGSQAWCQQWSRLGIGMLEMIHRGLWG